LRFVTVVPRAFTSVEIHRYLTSKLRYQFFCSS